MQRYYAMVVATCALFLSACCGIPSYTPSFWNDSGTVQYNNNCYNYSNNKRTDTFAQPGRAAGAMYTAITCDEVSRGARADGLDPVPPSGNCPNSGCHKYSKLALVVGVNWDYHWYRLDRDGKWSHKPGGTRATNVDNSGNIITNPETADRGRYTEFCGYFCACSSVTEGAGHENIQ